MPSEAFMFDNHEFNDLVGQSGTYAGIGSRHTPSLVGQLMTKLAKSLAKRDYVLRSGGAMGADTFFENGSNKREIFNANGYYIDREYKEKPDYIPPFAYDLVRMYHPRPSALNDYAAKLMARNALQILGMNGISPVDFVVCWTPDGCITHNARTKNTGGTGQAISIAYAKNIPIFNLALPLHVAQITEFLSKEI